MLKNAETDTPKRVTTGNTDARAVTPKSKENYSSGAPPWDTEWAAIKAAEALRYLGRNFPEALAGEPLRVLDPHEHAAHEAAKRGDREAYLEALRGYMRAGRDEALRIRRGAA